MSAAFITIRCNRLLQRKRNRLRALRKSENTDCSTALRRTGLFQRNDFDDPAFMLDDLRFYGRDVSSVIQPNTPLQKWVFLGNKTVSQFVNARRLDYRPARDQIE